MKNNTSFVYNFGLVIGDSLALVVSFVVAYILRVSLSQVPLSEHIRAVDFITTLLILLPFFIFVFALLGLYNHRIHEQRFSEIGRLFTGTFIGILFLISYSYVFNQPIFPARLVAFYGLGLAFVSLVLFRTIARGIRRELFKFDIGITKVLIVGDTRVTHQLIQSLARTDITGYKVVGVVGGNLHKHPDEAHYAVYQDFAHASRAIGRKIHMIVQTELYAATERNDEIVTYAQENHIAYRFAPGNNELFTGNIEAEVFHSVPVIAVHQTTLLGWGKLVKRAFDIVASLLSLLVFSPLLLLAALAIKLSDGGPVVFRQKRLSRFNRPVGIYKFRSHKLAYNGLSPEQAFTKMGRPELAVEYRKHADSLPGGDPRVSRVGRVLRATKLDELPQLLNVLKGDISLVGPRALVPAELDQYEKKNLILSVKSGLTGLAQVSGRADMPFEERRKLDLYYVQNWSFWGDIVILIKTVWVVFARRGVR